MSWETLGEVISWDILGETLGGFCVEEIIWGMSLEIGIIEWGKTILSLDIEDCIGVWEKGKVVSWNMTSRDTKIDLVCKSYSL
jgi:hypothetical protein